MAQSVRRPDKLTPFRFLLSYQQQRFGDGDGLLLAMILTGAQLSLLLLVVRIARAPVTSPSDEYLPGHRLVFVDMVAGHSQINPPRSGDLERPATRASDSRPQLSPLTDHTTEEVSEATGKAKSPAEPSRPLLQSPKDFRTPTRVPSACVSGPCMGSEKSGITAHYAGAHRGDTDVRWSLMRGIVKSPKLPPTEPERRPEPKVGIYSPPMVMAGGGARIPLWGGGPTDAQRRRDSTIHAANKIVILRMQARADSAVAARRDSIAKQHPRTRLHP